MPESGPSTLLALLQDHGCVTRFKPESVPPEILEKVFRASCHTSSPWNLHAWQFVVSSTPGARELVLRHCLDPGSAAGAPVLVVALADPAAWKRAPERLAEMVRSGSLEHGQEAAQLDRIRRLWSTGGAARTLAVARTHAAIQQLSLAAGALGLGVCWVLEYDPARLARALHIPENLLIVGVLGLGYCAERRSLPSPTLSRLVFSNAYGLPWQSRNVEEQVEGQP